MSQKMLYLKLNNEQIEEKVKKLKTQNNFKLEDRQKVSGELTSLISKLENQLNSEDSIQNLQSNFEINPVGWKTMLNNKGPRISDNILGESILLDPRVVKARLNNCIELEQHYVNKHNEILDLFDKYVNIMKYLTNLVVTIVIILKALIKHECDDRLKGIMGKRKRIDKIQNAITKQIDMSRSILNGEQNSTINEGINSLADFSRVSGGGNIYGTDYDPGMAMKNTLPTFEGKKTEFEDVLKTLESVKNQLSIYSSSKNSSETILSKKGWSNIDESGINYFNITTPTSSFNSSSNLGASFNTDLVDSDEQHVERYLRKCSDLEVLYIMKHKEFINLAKAIKEAIINVYKFYNVLMDLLALFKENECGEGVKYKLPRKSIITDLTSTLNAQKIIKDTINNIRGKSNNNNNTFSPIIPSRPRTSNRRTIQSNRILPRRPSRPKSRPIPRTPRRPSRTIPRTPTRRPSNIRQPSIPPRPSTIRQSTRRITRTPPSIPTRPSRPSRTIPRPKSIPTPRIPRRPNTKKKKRVTFNLTKANRPSRFRNTPKRIPKNSSRLSNLLKKDSEAYNFKGNPENNMYKKQQKNRLRRQTNLATTTKGHRATTFKK